MTYNGWKNYETWAVGMYLDGNYTGEGTYLEVLELVSEVGHYVRHEDPNVPEIWTLEQALKFRLADRLKNYVDNELETATEDLGAGLWHDLMRAAFDEVDWDELASAKLAEVSES